MGRSIKSLDPKVLEKVEQLLAEGQLSGNKIAKKCRIDFRLVSDVKKAWKEKQEDAQQEAAVADDPAPEERDILDSVKDADAKEAILGQYRQLLRQAIPVKKRVRILRDLISSPNVVVQMKALEKLDSIEGIGKKDDRPYEPGPLFVVDTIPAFNKRKIPIEGEDQ